MSITKLYMALVDWLKDVRAADGTSSSIMPPYFLSTSFNLVDKIIHMCCSMSAPSSHLHFQDVKDAECQW